MSTMMVQSLRTGPARARGVTLFELMIALAVLAILAGLALPSYREFGIRQTVTSNVNSLLGSLNTARAEAVKRGRNVALIANGGNWNAGWQIVAGKADASGVVADPVSPGATQGACAADMDFDGVTPLCARFEGPVPDTYTVLAKATGSVDNGRVVFGPSGTAVGVTAFDFSVCRPSAYADATQSRRIVVAASGIVTTYRGTASSPAGTCG
jgi:type IV fimbrial biogenesis protein FimT